MKTNETGNSNLSWISHSDGLLESVFDNLPDVCYCVDAQGGLQFVNENGRRLTGLKNTELVGKSVFDLFPKLTRKRWATAAQNTRETGHWIIQVAQPLCSGDSAPIELSVSYQQTDDSEIFICIARATYNLDESARLLNLVAEATASYSGQEFFESLMEHMARLMNVDHAFITECLDQPPSRVRMLAFWSCGEFTDNMEYDLIGTPCDTVINGRKSFHVENRLGDIYPKEKKFAKSYFGVPIYDSTQEKVIGHMAFLNNTDMSEEGLDCAAFDILASRAAVELQRTKAEQALRKSEEKYRLLVENQTDLVLRLDLDKYLQFVSPSCCARLAKSEVKLLDTNFKNLIHSSELDAFDDTWQKALISPTEQNCELRILTSKGWCWFIWSIKGVTNSDGAIEAVIAVGRDISKRRHAEDQARKTIQQLAHVGRLSSIGEMASGIAHELNQPLTAIMSFAQASQRMIEAGNVDLDEYKSILTRIAANAETAGEIIRRVRGFVRKGEPSNTPIDIGILLHEVKSLLSTELRHCEVALVLHVEDNLPPVSGDPIQIQQVLVNLVRNAMEAISDHNTQRREIHIVAKKGSLERLYLEVRDTGPGIPDELKNRLFETFTTTKSYGLGIGLSICHTIIENHGGNLAVESKRNEGTLFHFSLPYS